MEIKTQTGCTYFQAKNTILSNFPSLAKELPNEKFDNKKTWKDVLASSTPSDPPTPSKVAQHTTASQHLEMMEALSKIMTSIADLTKLIMALVPSVPAGQVTPSTESNTQNSENSSMDIDSQNLSNYRSVLNKRTRNEMSNSSVDEDPQPPSKIGVTSDRQEAKDKPAPPPPADKQISNEAREIPPQHQEETSSGKSTSHERSVKKNTSASFSSLKTPTNNGEINNDGWKKQRGRQKGRSRKSSPSSPSSRAKSCHSFGAGKERSRSPVKPP